jgi:lysylphosphatidylglycerol synthetase-like protein (DUF2156 family)
MSTILHQPHNFPTAPRSAVRAAAALLAILLAVRSALGVDWPNTDSLLVPDGAAHLWLALVLVMVAYGLARGAREAWTLLSLACLADLAVALGTRAPISVVASLTLALAFLLGRGQFTVRCPTPSRRLGYAGVAMALSGTWLLPTLDSWVTFSLQGVLLLAGTAGVVVLLRPEAPLLDEVARDKVARALALSGGAAQPGHGAAPTSAATHEMPNPIWSYAFEPDKAHFMSDHGPGGVAYRVCAGVALAAGEPIGPAPARQAVAREFGTFCRAHGWLPAFYQVADIDVDAYGAAGLRALKIGEEAIIDVSTFTLEGKPIANVRHCVTHAERLGLHVEIYLHGVDDEATVDGIAAVSDAWLAAQAGRGEMGFSMGRFSRAAICTTCTIVARDDTGLVQAFITFRQARTGHAMVLDLMRRRPAAQAGTIDFLIARALERFRDEGVQRASLSLAPLANACEERRAPRLGRVLEALFEHGNGLYHYKSLYNFKKKFAPRWEPRYLLYPARPWALPRVALAVVLVHLPRGSLRPPHPRDLARGVWRLLRGSLDWRHGLQPGPLARTLWLMIVITLAAAMPELWRALLMLGSHATATSYAVLSLAIASCNVLGALGLLSRLDIGRKLLALGALGFFVQAIWGLSAGYLGGWLGWGLAIGLAPIEAWVIWFLLQPEVRAHLREARQGAGERRRPAVTQGNTV